MLLCATITKTVFANSQHRLIMRATIVHHCEFFVNLTHDIVCVCTYFNLSSSSACCFESWRASLSCISSSLVSEGRACSTSCSTRAPATLLERGRFTYRVRERKREGGGECCNLPTGWTFWSNNLNSKQDWRNTCKHMNKHKDYMYSICTVHVHIYMFIHVYVCKCTYTDKVQCISLKGFEHVLKNSRKRHTLYSYM